MMAKVVMFPIKKKLPKEVEDRLHEIAKEYVETLSATMVLFGIEDAGDPNCEEIFELIGLTFAEGIVKAVDELEES